MCCSMSLCYAQNKRLYAIAEIHAVELHVFFLFTTAVTINNCKSDVVDLCHELHERAK